MSLGKRTRSNSEVTFKDTWLASRGDNQVSGWYKGSGVLSKRQHWKLWCYQWEEMPFAPVYPQIHSIRTQCTRYENKKILSSLPKQGCNHEGVKQLNYWWVYFISLKGNFPTHPTSIFTTESQKSSCSCHRSSPSTQSEWNIWHLKTKSAEMWLVTSPPI